MTSTFTPTDVVDMSKEKEWPSNLGMLGWDDTSIVFTKRSLIEFLKYTGISVDTNFSNIQKLPRYAKFGKLTAGVPQSNATEAETVTESGSTSDDFKPSRRVRTAPGGNHTDIFGADFQETNDALSEAPPPPSEPTITPATSQTKVEEPEEEVGIAFSSEVRPSRRVRTNPGGNSSIGSLWDDATTEEFKPTRRVRQGPGGQDNVSGLF
ncbi:hypothetical protein D9758_003141 [Tetrapyrgos nigripes]|uniref:Uncharacterized protein n=1 Tax=Tetrapyrgos nigripes TaxID=182062 RepID=A0A8H5GIM8_9AGAR|nr:hypothetical protein D9758_003141 [Tetrapyrgos nigripes]